MAQIEKETKQRNARVHQNAPVFRCAKWSAKFNRKYELMSHFQNTTIKHRV